MAELNFLTPANYNGNEIRNFVHQTVAVLPDATIRKYQVVGFGNSLYWSTGVVWYRIGQVVGALEEDLDAGGFKVTNVADAIDPSDAANLKVVQDEIAKLVDAAPAMLDTLRELAEALNNDPDFANTIMAQLTDLDARLDAIEQGTTGALARKFAGPVGDGTATEFILLHSLNTTDVAVQVFDAVTKEQVITSAKVTDKDNVTLGFAIAPAAGAYRAVVLG